MFTGLIEDLGSVSAIEREGEGATLTILTRLAPEVKTGDSIAVNGVCLTATAVNHEGFETQAMIETLRRSSLNDIEPGSPVNLELAMRAGDRLGGHIVQGHVDGTATVASVREEGFSRVLGFDADPSLTRYMVEKGSVAIDGVSLTISALSEEGFDVSLIPETLTRTILGAATAGTAVNIEVDVLAKHVERLLGARA